jgi:hypothetical protein
MEENENKRIVRCLKEHYSILRWKKIRWNTLLGTLYSCRKKIKSKLNLKYLFRTKLKWLGNKKKY